MKIRSDVSAQFSDHLTRVPQSYIDATIRNAEGSTIAGEIWYAKLLQEESERRERTPNVPPKELQIPTELTSQQLLEFEYNLQNWARECHKAYTELSEDHPDRSALWDTGRMIAILSIAIGNWVDELQKRSKDTNYN